MVELIGRFQPSWRPYAAAGLATLATSICEAGTLVLVTVTAVSVAGGDESVSVGGFDVPRSRLIAVAAVLLVLRLGLAAVHARVTSRLAAHTLLSTRQKLLAAYVEATWERQSQVSAGLLPDLLSARAEVAAYSAVILTGLMVAVVNVVVLGASALVIQPVAVVAMAVVAAALGAALRPLNRRTRALSHDYVRANERYLARIADLARNARDLHLYGAGRAFAAEVDEEQARAAVPYGRARALATFTPQTYQTLGLGLALAGLALASSFDTAQVASLGAVVLLLLRGLSYGQQMLTSTQALNERIPTMQGLVDAYDGLVAGRRPEGGARAPARAVVALDSLAYSYGEADVLADIDLVVRPGEMVGLVGPSGSGKSTLLQLLAGMREPTRGAVTVGGIPLVDLDPAWWATEVALVSQSSDLLTDTVERNISFLRPIEREAVETAVVHAQLADEVAALGGLDAGLSREERSLSGGQLQRLSIARGLAGSPSLLLLDEPTSALDVGTEARFQEVLAELHGEVTMVIVAHRLSTVASCDRILVLDGGRIVAEGPPSEVLAEFGRDARTRWELTTGGPSTPDPL